MSSSWETHNRRTDVLNLMIAEADARGIHREPWTLTPAVWQEFADEAEVLRALHDQWHHALAGAVVLAAEDAEDLRGEVLRAYAETVNRHRGLCRVLEIHADHPALRGAAAQDRQVVAAAAGCTPQDLRLPSVDECGAVVRPQRSWWRRVLFEEPA